MMAKWNVYIQEQQISQYQLLEVTIGRLLIDQGLLLATVGSSVLD